MSPPASNTDSTRAGRYITQPNGYRAFIPAPLPPKPAIDTSGVLQMLLSSADLALGRLDGSIQTLPNPDLFVYMYVRKEAVLSSQIEGTQSSLNDLLAAEAQLLAANDATDVDEIVNYIAAMKYGLRRLNELPVSVRLIREIHEILLHGRRGHNLTPGEIRTSQNWIAPTNSSITSAAYVSPPPHELAAALGNLESYLHAVDDIPLLIRIGTAHAQLETIHPFLDGNGRIGRLLITLLLCANHTLAQPVLYISNYFKQNRAEYYEKLQAIRDRGEWEQWIAFFLTGISQVSAEAADTARRILEMREQHRIAITENLGRTAGNGHRVLEHLYDQPIVSVDDVMNITGTTFTSANQVVSRLLALGILIEITGQARNRRFRYEPYVKLFT